MTIEQRSITIKSDVSQSPSETPFDEKPANGTGTNIIDLYLNEIRETPLLTKDEEIILGRAIQTGFTAKLELENPVAVEKQKELEEQIKEGKIARDYLIKASTRLVVSIAKRYRSNNIPLDNLIQEGNIGLMRATDKFDPERGRFSTYATRWIRQAITQALSDQGRTIRLPIRKKECLRKIHKIARRLEQEKGREPTAEEIADEMNFDPEEVQSLIERKVNTLSLEKPWGAEENAELIDFIEDPHSPDPQEETNQKALRETFEKVLDRFTPRTANIIKLRYGLEKNREHTLEEIGRKHGLTRERIRQIQRDALQKLRHPSKKRLLKDFTEN